MKFKLLTIGLCALISLSSYAKSAGELLRTNKKIIPTEELTAPYYTIQVLALKQQPQDADFFENLQSAREVVCTDGFTRYFAGQYESENDALLDLPRIQQLGKKFQDAFIVNTQLTPIKKGAFRNKYTQDGRFTQNKVTKVHPDGIYLVQLTASRFPFYTSEIKEFSTIFEFYMPDQVYRYTTGILKGEEANTALEKAIQAGYKDAIIVEYTQYEKFKIE